MPLYTSLTRDGERVPGVAVEWWQLEAYEEFIRQEDGVEPWYPEALGAERSPGQVDLHSKVGQYTFRLHHRKANPFYALYHGKARTKEVREQLLYLGSPDVDTEYLIVRPGDVYRMWR